MVFSPLIANRLREADHPLFLPTNHNETEEEIIDNIESDEEEFEMEYCQND